MTERGAVRVPNQRLRSARTPRQSAGRNDRSAAGSANDRQFNHARRRAPRTLGSSPFSGSVDGGFGGAFGGGRGRDAPGLADDGFHAVDDVALVAEVGGGFGGFDAARVFPAAVHGRAGQGGEAVERFVAAGHLGADGAVDRLSPA